MRCKTCEYRLWNLTSRQCPECGTPFVPSQYEFMINSVQFCCPHCDQGYYGTGLSGHLVPADFDCASCGRHIHMDQMVLRPTAGVGEDQTVVDRNPWLDRKRIGRWAGWFKTIGLAMGDPNRLMKNTPQESSLGQAASFATITNLPGLIFSTAPITCYFSFFIAIMMMAGMAGGGFGGGGLLAGFGGAFVLAMLMLVLLFVVWGLMIQGVLVMGGRPAFGIARTYQALWYSSGVNILLGIPCIGASFWFIPAVWWIVSAALMVKQAQQVSGLRATMAVLTGPLLVILVSFGMFGACAVFIVRAAPRMAGGATGVATINATLVNFATTNNGAGPAHAIQLIASTPQTAFGMPGFTGATTGTTEADIPVGQTTLDQFNLMHPVERVAVAGQIADAMPADVVAHRFGDYVFVYHGIDFIRNDPNLWSVIAWPDPDVNAAPTTAVTTPNPGIITAMAGMVTVGTIDGSINTFPLSQLNNELRAQNQLRANVNLPPLPHPSTVKHGQPAAAGPRQSIEAQ